MTVSTEPLFTCHRYAGELLTTSVDIDLSPLTLKCVLHSFKTNSLYSEPSSLTKGNETMDGVEGLNLQLG